MNDRSTTHLQEVGIRCKKRRARLPKRSGGQGCNLTVIPTNAVRRDKLERTVSAVIYRILLFMVLFITQQEQRHILPV